MLGSILLIGAALLLLGSVWHGWRSGLPKMLIELGGFIGASLAAWSFYPFIASKLQPVTGLPYVVVAVISAFAIWLVVVIVVKLIGFLFVKKTKHYAMPLKSIFGMSGAVLGALEGLFIICVCAIGLRVAGSIAESQLVPRSDGTIPTAHPLAQYVIDMKKRMDQGWAAPLLAVLDPIPPSFHTNLKKFNIMVRDRAAIERFLAFPQMRDLLAQPRVQAVIADPQVVEAVKQRKFAELTGNANVVAAVNDPALWAELQKFPWGEALDYAVPTIPSPPAS